MGKKNQGYLMSHRWLILGLALCFSVANGQTSEAEEELVGISEEAKTTKSYESPRSAGLSFDFSPTAFPRYTYSNGSASTLQAYGTVVTLEWLPLLNYGKLGVSGTSGFYLTGGQSIGTESLRVLAIPISANLSYYFDYWQNQFLVPFVRVGGTLTFAGTWNEFTGARSNLSTFAGIEYFGGVQLNLNPLETSAATSLDHSTGINTTYFVIMYGLVQGLSSSQPDLSRTELRIGFRFEI